MRSLVQCSPIRGEKTGNRILPCKFLFDPSLSELAHSFSFIGILEQPEDLVCEVANLVLGVAVQRCLIRAESAFLRFKLNDGLTESHVFHDLDHRGHVVHPAWLVRIYANVGRRKNLQHFAIGDSSGESDHVFEVLLMVHFPETCKSRSSPDKCELNVAPTRILHMLRNIQEDVQPILLAHVSDVTDQIRLATFHVRIGHRGIE